MVKNEHLKLYNIVKIKTHKLTIVGNWTTNDKNSVLKLLYNCYNLYDHVSLIIELVLKTTIIILQFVLTIDQLQNIYRYIPQHKIICKYIKIYI